MPLYQTGTLVRSPSNRSRPGVLAGIRPAQTSLEHWRGSETRPELTAGLGQIGNAFRAEGERYELGGIEWRATRDLREPTSNYRRQPSCSTVQDSDLEERARVISIGTGEEPFEHASGESSVLETSKRAATGSRSPGAETTPRSTSERRPIDRLRPRPRRSDGSRD